MVEKFESKIVRLGESLRVSIPPDISKKMDIDDQTEVALFVNDEGNIEIEVQSDKTAVAKCSICGNHKANKKCLNCGRHVCLSCFWAFGSLCKKCAKKF